MAEEEIINKKNLWIITVTEGIFGDIYGPYSMAEVNGGLDNILVEISFNELDDSLIGIEVDSKGRLHYFPISNGEIDIALERLSLAGRSTMVDYDDPDEDEEVEDYDELDEDLID